MITVVFEKEGKWGLGVKTQKGILDVEAALAQAKADNVPVSVKTLIEQGASGKCALEQLVDEALQNGSDCFVSEESLRFGPCVPEPSKIICVGLNYKKHAEESNMAPPEAPLLFSKFSNTLTGHGQNVKLPEKSTQVDYEVELAIVIGKEAKNVKREDALSYVYGYCNANDLSARDLQFKSSQWLLGKTCDDFSPIGPYLVTADEVGDPNQLQVKTIVNGDVRQNSNTSDMIFRCDEIISYISEHMTLYPGDVILTGTPEGVIMGLPEEKREWLKAGDEVTVEIEKLGTLTNKMV
ncbi:fumarylacetoacetate hydrolase family protein [Aneurinibacillus sp. REN35]|uniref:fumarylacetoacetate hydrolase family protein n=1 Tax=Aneurinibacillus sp. REN35 TaxID=3237286 RepID=UPI00352837A8